jgi:mycothiol synthase
MTTTQLLMRLPQLVALPPAGTVPAGYELRTAGADDQAGVAAVCAAAFEEPWDVGRVRRDLSVEEGVEATYVVTGPNGVAATASARVLALAYPKSGYVHWVAAHPNARGLRLGEAVTRRVLAHFAEAGLFDAVLETDDFRIPAVRTYLRLGFVPEYRGSADQARWSKVFTEMLRGRAA